MAAKRRRRPAAPRSNPRGAAPAPPPPAVKPDPPRPARPRPSWAGPAPGQEDARWSRWALLVLLALTLVVQVVVGAVTHLIGHRQRLLVVDLVFPQAVFVLAACVLLMPLVKRLMHQPRMLRLLEALSLGALYALFALLLTSVIVRPAAASSSLDTDQLIDRLTSNDALGLLLADLLAMVIAVQLYPGLQRILTAPGRRARQRLLERQAAGGSGARSARKPRR